MMSGRAGFPRLAGVFAIAVLVACGARDADDRDAGAAGAESASPAAAPVALASNALPVVTVYKSPTCGCCKEWVKHLEKNGFTVVAHDTSDIVAVASAHGIPPQLGACHTALVGRYVIEGHVPAGDIKKLLYEKPEIAGLAVPGMPASAPGMDMGSEPYDVIAYTSGGETSVFARH